jgi:hypothetical protein
MTFQNIAIIKSSYRYITDIIRTDGRRTLTHDKSSPGLWPGELKRGGNSVPRAIISKNPQAIISKTEVNFFFLRMEIGQTLF